MQKLIQTKLFNPNPITVSGFLIERYNKCLDLLGVKPTKLKQFTIDAKGWSPEVASEKKNEHYLNSGDANNHAIIISPDQKGAIVLKPFFHFDQKLIEIIFEKYENEIKDITKESALCIDFNQGMDVYNDAFDLLKYNKLDIKFYLINDLKKIKEEQLELENVFDSANNFVDEKLHKKILDSVRKYGDLRYRDLQLKPIRLEIDSFYTQAFDGVFVFKDFIKPIFVFESKEAHKKAISNTSLDVLIYHINDQELITKLEDYIVIKNNLKTFVSTDRYSRIKRHVFAQLFSKTEHEFGAIFNNELLFKRYLNKLDLVGKKRLLSLEYYLEDNSSYINHDILHATFAPHNSLTKENQYLIWKLLTKIAPKDPLHMYLYTKNLFKDNYVTWNDSYKDYILQFLKDIKN